MKFALTFVAVIASSTSLLAQPHAEFVRRVQPIAYQPAPATVQPPPASPRTVPEPETDPETTPVPQTQTVDQSITPFQALLNARSDFQLARTPHMFGDSLGMGISLSVSGITTSGSSTIPLGGGNRRFSIADNNMALPVDRSYFVFNHFHNALNTSFATAMGSGGENTSINQYTFGYERTFGDFENSIEVRLPFVNEFEFNSPTFGVFGGSVGNMLINYKRVLAQGENIALSGGAGLGIPTGGNALGFIDTDAFKIENDAFHFNPFLALVGGNQNGGPCFYHAFFQFDVPFNGNDVIVVPDGDPTMEFHAGTLDDKSLFHASLGGGCWLFQGRDLNRIKALAALFELHYTETLGSPDSVSAITPMNNFIGFGTPLQDARILNMTLGLHAQLAPRVNLRLATVFPLRDENGLHRAFDAEFILSLICLR